MATLKKIKRNNINAGRIDEITMFQSETTRFFDRNCFEIEKDLMKICSVVDSRVFDLEADRVHAMMVHYAYTGLDMNDVKFVPILCAASDSRKGQATWMNAAVAPKYWKWAMCGLTLPQISMKIAINKYMAYIGLLSSGSRLFKEKYGIEIDPHRIAVVDDGFVEVTGIMDVVNDDGTVEYGVERTVRINAFDGFGTIRAELTNGESVTIRGPWIKAFVQATLFEKLKETVGAELTTLYGNKVKFDDVDIILTKSCFKAANLYDNWETYVKSFIELGHNIAICVQEHAPKLKGLPYQQGQTLQGTDEDVEKFAQHSLKIVQKYEDGKEATKLLRGWHKYAAKLYPSLLKESHTQKTIQQKYFAKKYSMMAGRIPELGYNAFIAPDMQAFADHLAGRQIVGSLKAGECAILTAEEGKMTDITRSPHLDNAHVLLINTKKMNYVPETTPTVFINVFDLTTIRLRCDYDGDHVWYSQNIDLVELVVRSAAILQNLPIDWEAPSSPKSVVNKATIAEFIGNLLKGSEIGLYADALTKMWANGYGREVCDWLTYAGNVLIDAAKHGNVKIVKPDAVADLDNVSLPGFCKYAKADKDHPAESKYWTEERFVCEKKIEGKKPVKTVVYASEYKENVHGKITKVLHARTKDTDSFLDKYSRRVKELVPDTLEIKGMDEEVFDSTILLIKPDRKIGKLAGLSKRANSYNAETGKYEDGGLFQRIAFRRADEWKEMMENEAFQHLTQKEWEEAKAKEAQSEMIAWARERYADNETVQSFSDEKILEAVYDIVARNIFNTKMSDGMENVVKNAFWCIFGEMACKVIKMNLEEKRGLEALSFEPTIEDFELDDSDEDNPYKDW